MIVNKTEMTNTQYAAHLHIELLKKKAYLSLLICRTINRISNMQQQFAETDYHQLQCTGWHLQLQQQAGDPPTCSCALMHNRIE